MKNSKRTYLLSLQLLAFSFCCFFSIKLSAQSKVYIIDLDGTIDNGLATYVERGLNLAGKDQNVDAVIFHIDTFGGLVEAADKIRKSILDSPLKTIAFIDKNAASAGALIALACDSIYMTTGASIGAATVVQGSGEKASEKMQSYMRSLMRSTAESTGRNPKIAEAMVDESISIDGVVEQGKLLALTSNEAAQLGISEGSAQSLQQIYAKIGLDTPQENYLKEQWEESVLRFLSSPIMSSLLILMMLGGLYFELQSPGVGFPGLIAAIGALLFFAPLYIMGLAQSWEIVLFVVGIILLLLEIFVIPGFGVTGITGITMIILSLGAAMIGNIGLNFPALYQIGGAIWTLSISLIIGIALISSLAKYLPSNPHFRKLVLENSLTSVYEDSEELSLLGKIVKTITPLRPTGTVQYEGKRYTVVSDGEFIDTGVDVEIVSAVGGRIIVTKKT